MKSNKFTVLLLSGVVLVSGCSMLNRNRGIDELPPAAAVFAQQYDPDTDGMIIEYNGRTYSPFGTLKNKLGNDAACECIGSLENDSNTRLYTLTEDPCGNYIMLKSAKAFMDQPFFYRATDTKQKNIFTPSFIESLGYENWGSSGVHYEQSSASFGLICEAKNIREICYTAEVNGQFTEEGGVRYANCKELKPGDVFIIEIVENRLSGIADNGKPFSVTMHFSVNTTGGETFDVSGVFNHDMMLGGYLRGIEIRYDEDKGYYLLENF